MFKKNYLIVIIIAICVALTISLFIKHREQKLLEAHISARINYEVVKIISDTIKNNEIVEEILESDEVRVDRIYTLHRNSVNIGYRIRYIDDASNTVNNHNLDIEYQEYSTSSIRSFCVNILTKHDKNHNLKGGEILVELDDSSRKKFEAINHIYKGWISSFDSLEGIIMENNKLISDLEYYDNYYGRYSINTKDWINFITKLEEETFESIEYLALELFESPKGWGEDFQIKLNNSALNVLSDVHEEPIIVGEHISSITEQVMDRYPHLLIKDLGPKIFDEILRIEK